jgi:cytochrome c biogenesis protein CcmG/thiol:disulfide interchange protein DsbE
VFGLGLARGDDETGAVFLDDGRPAPDFALVGFRNEEVRLSGYRGKPVFLYFWASWCLPCREEAPLLEAAWRKWREEGLAFVGVNMQDRQDDAAAFLAEFNLTFPSGIDRDGKTYIDYGVYGVPEAFFIKPDGTLWARWIGPLDGAELEEMLASLSRQAAGG